jgi:hypothetical protein
MANEFIARNGVISKGNVVVTGSLTTSGSLTTTGTITATTLVVQTITSSISSITGSTNFGTLSSNTHTFTGSINASGSGTFVGSVSASALTLNSLTADYAATITNVQDSSQGLLVRASDNDTGLYVLNLQSSVGATSQTWVSRLIVDKAGSVGIGTTSPRDTFVVSGNGGAVLERFTGTDPYSGDLYFYSAKGTAASPTTKANGDTAMGIRPRAYDGTSYLDVASIVSKIEGSVSTNVMYGNLIFSTNGGSTTLTERMKIYPAGGVVINASSTNQTLTTGDAGVTRTNTYFGTGQVRIGGGSDHGSSTVLSVAPGVVTFDRPGVGGGALTINSSGYVTLPSQPSFLAVSNAGQQDYTTGQVIVFNLTRHNTSSCYNTSTGRFTAPVAGRYLFSVNFYTYASYPVSITLTINGSQYVPSDVVPLIYKPADAVTLNLGFSTILELSANDYVEIRVRSGGYTARVYMSHSHFAGQLLS